MTARHLSPRTRPLVLLCTMLLLLGGCALPFGSKGPAKPAQPVVQEQCLVLALPASGPYATIAAKIRRGADQARQELSAANITLRLENIDTQSGDWLTKLAALPRQCTVVGGPLQARNYSLARSNNTVNERAFFTFLPALAQGEEGIHAWRFFPSRQDQIDALLAFTSDTLGIDTYGVLYPTDNYGVHMTSLLEQALAARHLPLHKAAYDPAAVDAWTESAARLVAPEEGAGNTGPIPHTPFEALFLPDSWKSMDMLTSSLLYNGEDRLVLLGTTLWEQSLSGKLVPNAHKYALAVFPGAWDASRAPKGLQTPGHDFWTALGYDFVQFGAAMDLQDRPSASVVTAQAARAAHAAKALAPISWDDAGVAHQALYIFQVSPTGKMPLNLEQFKQSRAATLERAALRMQGLPPAEGSLLTPGTAQAAPMPTVAPLGSTPRPSYKLRLPSQR
ncbi:MAG: hypothetical protein IJA79_02115 [Desulfovibrio sp.]|nr:hypothetical protein [Desulfovibrio sp.]